MAKSVNEVNDDSQVSMSALSSSEGDADNNIGTNEESSIKSDIEGGKSVGDNKKSSRKKLIKNTAIDLVWIVIGSFIGAIAVVGVMEPNNLSAGGIVGFIRILQHYTDFNFSTIYYIAAAIVLLILYLTLGVKEMGKAIVVSAIYPTVTKLVEMMDIRLLESKDLILAAIFCGILQGISIGIIAWRGYMFPGTDGLAKALRKKLFPHISQSILMSCLDVSAIVCSAFVFDRNIALYALVTQIIITKSMNVVVYGMSPTLVQLEIITEKEAMVSAYIINTMHRGVTKTDVMGEYTNKVYSELRLLCSVREAVKLKKSLGWIDPDAFVTLHKVDSVWGVGEGFSAVKGED